MQEVRPSQIRASRNEAGDELFLTLDIGGTKCVAAVADAQGNVVAQERGAPVLQRGAAPFVAGLCDLLERVRARPEATGRALRRLGVAAPGPLDLPAGRILDAPNLGGVGVADVGGELRRRFGLEVLVENDASCGALAEGLFGAGRGVADFFFLTLSTGIGGGVVTGGRLLRGASGNGAELGHIVVDPKGPRCGCGRTGCLEAICGGLNLARRVAADPGFAASALPGIAGDENFAAKHLFAGARAGDPLATRFLAEFVDALARAIADLVHVFDPRRVILGTMAVESGDLFLDELRGRVTSQVWPVYRAHLEIVPAQCGAAIAVLAPLALAITTGRLPESR
jgi:glucokinase